MNRKTKLKMTAVNRAAVIAISLMISAGLSQPATALSDDLKDCMIQSMESADFEDMTIAQLRLKCDKEINSGAFVPEQVKEDGPEVVKERMRQDKEHVLQPFTLMVHKPNYILLGAYNGNSYDPSLYRDQFDDPAFQLDDVEAQFQLSIKFPLLVNLFKDTMDVYAAYTNHSFWQVYNADSSPFRETNHEPEIWAQFHPGWELFGFKNTWNSFGAVHQSNGRSGTLSRSWNRLYAWLTMERGNFAMSFKPWYRIPDDKDDDNPDITDYLGHFELSATYKLKEHVFSVMSRNNLESGFEKGAVELSWSFPLWDYPYLKGYVQYFYGYGESLISYNHRVNKIGIGFSLADWL